MLASEFAILMFLVQPDDRVCVGIVSVQDIMRPRQDCDINKYI
jgi:hypothetical protein